MKEADRNHELQRRTDVLQETNGRERQPVQRSPKQQQRNGSNNAGQRENSPGGGRHASGRQSRYCYRGQGNKDYSFDQQAVRGVNIDLLTHQTIKTANGLSPSLGTGRSKRVSSGLFTSCAIYFAFRCAACGIWMLLHGYCAGCKSEPEAGCSLGVKKPKRNNKP